MVQEQDGTGAATANLLGGLGVDQIFARTEGITTMSFLTDALGSTNALADAPGTIQTSYTYEPFGATTSSGTTNTNSYQFTGRENDGATGLYFNRARYSSPTFGRFIAEDPLGFPGGPDPNLYAYVGDNPISFVDPFGLDPGNGCGFFGFGCVASFFGRFFGGCINVGRLTLGFVEALDTVSFFGLGVFGIIAIPETYGLSLIFAGAGFGAAYWSARSTGEEFQQAFQGC